MKKTHLAKSCMIRRFKGAIYFLKHVFWKQFLKTLILNRIVMTGVSNHTMRVVMKRIPPVLINPKYC